MALGFKLIGKAVAKGWQWWAGKGAQAAAQAGAHAGASAGMSGAQAVSAAAKGVTKVGIGGAAVYDYNTNPDGLTHNAVDIAKNLLHSGKSFTGGIRDGAEWAFGDGEGKGGVLRELGGGDSGGPSVMDKVSDAFGLGGAAADGGNGQSAGFMDMLGGAGKFIGRMLTGKALPTIGLLLGAWWMFGRKGWLGKALGIIMMLAGIGFLKTGLASAQRQAVQQQAAQQFKNEHAAGQSAGFGGIVDPKVVAAAGAASSKQQQATAEYMEGMVESNVRALQQAAADKSAANEETAELASQAKLS